MDDAVYKGFKKQRKKLGKKVLAGKMTVDEARAKMGRQFAQKGAGEPQGAGAEAAAATASTHPSSRSASRLIQAAVTVAARGRARDHRCRELGRSPLRSSSPPSPRPLTLAAELTSTKAPPR